LLSPFGGLLVSCRIEGWLFLEGKNALLIGLHAHDGPAFRGGGFVEALVEPDQGVVAIVGIFTLCMRFSRVNWIWFVRSVLAKERRRVAKSNAIYTTSNVL